MTTPSRYPALAREQEQLLALLKQRTMAEPFDQEIASLASSREIALVREISVWWRCRSLRRVAPLTGRLLDQRGKWLNAVLAFIHDCSVPSQVDVLGPQFLSHVCCTDTEPLACSVAAFERAYLLSGRGHPVTTVVLWDREPYAVLGALLHARPVPEPDACGARWITTFHPDTNGFFTVTPAPA